MGYAKYCSPVFHHGGGWSVSFGGEVYPLRLTQLYWVGVSSYPTVSKTWWKCIASRGRIYIYIYIHRICTRAKGIDSDHFHFNHGKSNAGFCSRNAICAWCGGGAAGRLHYTRWFHSPVATSWTAQTAWYRQWSSTLTNETDITLVCNAVGVLVQYNISTMILR